MKRSVESFACHRDAGARITFPRGATTETKYFLTAVGVITSPITTNLTDPSPSSQLQTFESTSPDTDG